MYLVDTNVLSELRKIRAGKAHHKVVEWADSVNANELFVSAITLMEIELGILSVARRDTRQGALLRSWFDRQVLPEFLHRTLAIDTRVALRCAQLHVPDPRSERDALIAATALVHGMELVTRNTIDFEGMGVTLINPWNA